MTTIALADTDSDTLGAVSSLLEAEGYSIATYESGAAVCEDMGKVELDLLVIGLEMPRLEGAELLCKLRQKSDAPVIVLSNTDDEIDELYCFKMGADDVVRKPFSGLLLVERVKAVLRRASQHSALDINPPDEGINGIVERGLLRMNLARHIYSWKGIRIALTVTEALILYALAQRPGVMRSRNALMDAAYRDQVYVNDRTIDTHIKRLRKKFKAIDVDFDFIETLYGIGYRFKEG